MPLILTLRAGPTPVPPLRLDGGGATIGRGDDADWVLPDPRSLVSGRHAEILHRDGAYAIADRSTNGTSVNGYRIDAPRRLAEGDVIEIGDYRITVSLTAPVPDPRRAAGVGTAMAAGGLAAFARGAGLDPRRFRSSDDTLAAAGALLRRLVEQMRAQEAARLRARGEIGVGETEPVGPVAAAPTVEQALATLLTGPSDAMRALDTLMAAQEAHRVAVLGAMQASLRDALDRVSPQAIRTRARKGGDADLWRAYEAGFGGEADFVERFARAYAQAYAAATSTGKPAVDPIRPRTA